MVGGRRAAGAILGNTADGHLIEHIGRIYDCVLFPENWQTTIAAMQESFGWHNAVLGVYSFLNHGTQFQVLLGIPEEYSRIVGDPSYVSDVFALWGGKERIDAAPLEEPVVQSQMGYPDTWLDNRYFKDFSVPQGIIDSVAIGLARDSTMIATLAGGRHGSRGPVTEYELAGLRVLAPHLRRAVTIANLFDNLQGQKQMFSATLETSRAGIVLVDEQFTIFHANSLAQQMLDNGNPVRAVNGRLVLREELSQSALSAAMAVGQGQTNGRGAGIPTRSGDGSILMVHTFPLKNMEIIRHVGSRATTVVVLAAAPGQVDVKSEALALLYDLTPAEIRIVGLAIEGLSMAEAAERLGIATSTVKTHLLRAYEKTGTHRQAELAALLRSISSPW